jgi:Ca2+-binding EF-hand superfamily protein
MSQLPSAQNGQPSTPLRKSDASLQQVKAAIKDATNSAPNSHVWEEPAHLKSQPSAIDRFELLLKSAIERGREFQKFANNPIQGMQQLFQRMDKNHSGKVDVSEIENLCKMIEFQGDTKQLDALFKRYDLDHNGVLTLEEFSRSLFRLDGDAEFKAKSAIARMREVLALRAGGYESLKAMGSQFRILDREKTGQLTKEEVNIGLDILFSAYKVTFTPAEKNSLFSTFDYDKSGTVSYDEFTRGIRGGMNSFREDWVKQAFRLLDTDGSGVVSTAEMGHTYDVSQNPAVMSGKVTPADAIRQFMKHFDANSDGQITYEEFLENYQWVSASVDNDDYFELMMRNAWHITGGQGWCQNTANLRVLVQHTRAPDEVVEVQHDMGLPRDPAKKYQEVIRRLTQQGVKDIKDIKFTS